MKIWITSLLVDDQAKALDFYTSKLKFKIKENQPMGEHRWLTLVDPDDPNGTELSLEPSSHEAVPPYKQKLKQDGIPMTSFKVKDIEKEFQRLKSLNVEFTQQPTEAGPYTTAVLDDTCGNLIQLIQFNE